MIFHCLLLFSRCSSELTPKYMHEDVNGNDASGCQIVSELLNVTSMIGDTPREPLETEGGEKI